MPRCQRKFVKTFPMGLHHQKPMNSNFAKCDDH